ECGSEGCTGTGSKRCASRDDLQQAQEALQRQALGQRQTPTGRRESLMNEAVADVSALLEHALKVLRAAVREVRSLLVQAPKRRRAGASRVDPRFDAGVSIAVAGPDERRSLAQR